MLFELLDICYVTFVGMPNIYISNTHCEMKVRQQNVAKLQWATMYTRIISIMTRLY